MENKHLNSALVALGWSCAL